MWKDEESGRFTLTEGFEEDSIFMGSNMSSTSLEVGLFKCSLIFFSMLPPLDNVPGVEHVDFKFNELLKIRKN